MEGNNWKPQGGQEVLITVSIDRLSVKKNDVVKVKSVHKCKCGRYVADIGVPLKNGILRTDCCTCDTPLSSQYFICDTCILTPIQTRRVEIAEEILNSIKHTDEVPDKVFVPEPVNN